MDIPQLTLSSPFPLQTCAGWRTVNEVYKGINLFILLSFKKSGPETGPHFSIIF